MINSLLLLFTCLLISCSSSDNTDELDMADRGDLEDTTDVVGSVVNDSEVDEAEPKKERIDLASMTDEEMREHFPETALIYSKIGGSSFVITKKIEASTDIDKEIIQTLTEFNAVHTGDGAMLTLPEDILFDFDSDQLRAEAAKEIDKLVNIANETEDDITIVGHTDSRGADDYNQQLSEGRANAVLEALVNSGVQKDRLIAEGRGADEPIAENEHRDGSDNPEGRQQNRRVEVTIHGLN